MKTLITKMKEFIQALHKNYNYEFLKRLPPTNMNEEEANSA